MAADLHRFRLDALFLKRVARALQDGLAPTLERLFPAALPPMPLPAAVAAVAILLRGRA